MQDGYIQLAHGNGGRLMRELLESVVFPALGSRESGTDGSAVAPDGRVPVLASDSFTVQPLFFPGGNIGSLAIHGTLNDLAVSGAEPAALTFNLVIEEGFAIAELRSILETAGAAAREAGVAIVGGDTKVVPRGQGSGVLIATTGLGWRKADSMLDIHAVQPGDVVLVSGPVGDHGATVMMAREDFGLSSDLVSDAACILPLARLIREQTGLRFMRDPTRGGLATVLHEIAHATGLGARLQESAIPVRPEVTGVCQLLGFNPLLLACEGRIVAIAAEDAADEILACWRTHPLGSQAARIGTLVPGGTVSLVTPLGGQRFIDELGEDPLPRIC
ncbi:MAG: Hydrogenase expression/formation protein HypE [Proteobacteria bacterium]|nr:Hydrogenase expression/formation protein HypE [Pseudomonadota bacterium]